MPSSKKAFFVFVQLLLLAAEPEVEETKGKTVDSQSQR